MAELDQQIPKDFCEHEREACPFCGKLVLYGHVQNDASTLLIHQQPSCDQFKACDSIDEFAALAIMKRKLDAGQISEN